MRRIFLLIAVVALFASQANAQIKFGLDVGANMANMKYDYKVSDLEPETKAIIAPRVGLAVDLKIPGPIGIGTGVFYSGKGVTEDLDKYNSIPDTATNRSGYSRTNIGYIELPVHLKWSFVKVLHLYVGPYAAMGIHGKQKEDYTYELGGVEVEVPEQTADVEFIDEVKELDNKVYMKGLDMGIDFGLGLRIPKFGVHAGYSMGLANIAPDYKTDLVEIKADDIKTKTSAIQFGVTYYF